MARPETMWDATQPDKTQLGGEGRIEEDVTRKPGVKPAKDNGNKSDTSGKTV